MVFIRFAIKSDTHGDYFAAERHGDKPVNDRAAFVGDLSKAERFGSEHLASLRIAELTSKYGVALKLKSVAVR